MPIYYESRLARIELDDDEKPKIDAEIEALVADETLTEAEKAKAKWSTVEALVGSTKRLDQIAADLVQHLEARTGGLTGKAMAVCMSRRICVKLYDAIIALKPDWGSDDDASGAVKIVMTGSASDPLDWQKHIGNKKRRDFLAKRARDPADPLKLVIVRDMWLTGFDAPCMNTMYIDKPMRGQALDPLPAIVGPWDTKSTVQSSADAGRLARWPPTPPSVTKQSCIASPCLATARPWSARYWPS